MMDNYYRDKSIDLSNQVLKKILFYNKSIGEYSTEDVCAVLIFLSMNRQKNIKEFDQYIEEYMRILKFNLENGRVNLTSSMFNGLGEVCETVSIVSKYTGSYTKFKNQLDYYLASLVDVKLQQVSKIFNVKSVDFDVLYGISGSLNYMLDNNDTGVFDYQISLCVDYLLELCELDNLDETVCPKWFIQAKNQFTETDRQKYPEGNINFSVSHGILGPVYVLSKACELGYVFEEGEIIIRRVLIYMLDYFYRYGEVDYLKQVLTLKEFVTKDVNGIRERESWCYGTLSSLLLMLKSSKSLGDIFIEDKVSRLIKQRSVYSVSDFGLDSVTICHGLAGTLMIMLTINNYDNYFDSELLEEFCKEILSQYDTAAKFGFGNIEIDEQGNIYSEDKQSILTGALGVVLSILRMNNQCGDDFLNRLLIN